MLGIPIARAFPEHLPDGLLPEPFVAYSVRTAHGSEHMALPMPAASIQASIGSITHCGTGTVRTRPCLLNRSTMHHRPSSGRRCAKVSAAASDRRRPLPKRTARMARSRKPFKVGVQEVPVQIPAARPNVSNIYTLQRSCNCGNLPAQNHFGVPMFRQGRSLEGHFLAQKAPQARFSGPGGPVSPTLAEAPPKAKGSLGPFASPPKDALPASRETFWMARLTASFRR